MRIVRICAGLYRSVKIRRDLPRFVKTCRVRTDLLCTDRYNSVHSVAILNIPLQIWTDPGGAVPYRYVKICTNLHRSAKIWTNLCKPVQICRDLQRSVEICTICTDRFTSVQFFTDPRRSVQICRDLYHICTNLYKSAKMCPDLCLW